MKGIALVLGGIALAAYLLVQAFAAVLAPLFAALGGVR